MDNESEKGGVINFHLTDIAELQQNGDVRSLSLSPLDDMLAGCGADDAQRDDTQNSRERVSKLRRPTRFHSTREG